MKRKLFFAALFVCGVVAGAFTALTNVKASPSANETSGGEQPASVYYDEHWKATEAVVSTDNKWRKFTDFKDPTPKTKKPKMVVTTWKVHGHIHFR